MQDGSATGMVQTVTGLVRPGQLGVTLTHEHLLVDLSGNFGPPEDASARELFNAPLTPETLGRIRYHGGLNVENYRLLDIDTAIDEAGLFRQYGGGTIVDASSIGIARDPVGLARISRATGVNVVMGAAFYVDAAHPEYVATSSVDELAGGIIRDVTEGVDGTGIRSGIIGEVGCSWPLTPGERKVVAASAKAQRATGAPILIHPGRDESSTLEILNLLAEHGADLSRTIVGHLDRTVFERETLSTMGETGCFFEWDLFGSEGSHYRLNPAIHHPNDDTKLNDIAWLISKGYGDRIVIAHDICTKHRLLKYGGHGYFYILAQIVPRMRVKGFTEESIEKIMVHNPAAALTFAAPEVG
ncbi:MAG: aryldialkylphosphatase [Acidobacteria bacterium]|jgi:phosphotriesterase-related protein|nr:aryldialkylphosphatase [Acidobacteriota bacterium]MDP6302335.1 aryldialkylphosphatase [SAR202 cluster bacterium]MDP7226341.1 aryldialkylphosphatase [SAR202 cluster bacterium]HJO81091.1 aryldialkylphosphatase [SAR202 cluster bacterium]|tara:strand:+ start:247 stop:1317 length:1071 start_codon:yes stop_codon:yes gene_type:complete